MKKNIFIILYSIVFIFSSLMTQPITSFAYTESEKEELKEDIMGAMADIRAVMEKSYAKKQEYLTELSDEGFDYELTSESFYEKGTPYTDFDYKRFIAAYACIQSFCMEHNIDISEGINGIDFIKLEYEERIIDEYIPERVTRYKEENGIYVENGEFYLTEPSDIPVYEKTDTGYVMTGTEFKNLETKETKYADINLSMISLDEVYAYFGLERKSFKEEEKERLDAINEALGESEPAQATFVITRKNTEYDTDETVLENAISTTTSSSRYAIIQTASTLLGAVPYEWGGKSRQAGYDTTWWTFNSNGKQSGLDCSGYVQWVLRTAGYEDWQPLVSVRDFLRSDKLEVINSEDLLPGDLGMFYPPESSTNHIGIYLGNGYWIHCSSSKGTVVVANNMKFALYRRIPDIDNLSLTPYFFSTENYIAQSDTISSDSEYTDIADSGVTDSSVVEGQTGDTTEGQDSLSEECPVDVIVADEPEAEEMTESENDMTSAPETPTVSAPSNSVTQTVQGISYTEADLYLMAKIVQCEAHAEGFNGWVAVAEVIRNRILNSAFNVSSIYEVVSAPRQFATYYKASNMYDDEVDPNVLEVCREVMNGQLAIFNNTNVISFKRNDGSSKFGKWNLFEVIGNHAFYNN